MLPQIEISQSDDFLPSTHLEKMKVETTLSFEYHSSQRGTKSHLKKIQSHLKSQFLPEMTLIKFQQNFQMHLKSNFLFTLI